MRFLIITQVPHKLSDGKIYSYGPYIREMNIWSRPVSQLVIVAPMDKGNPKPDAIDAAYDHQNIKLVPVSAINLMGFRSVIHTIVHLPAILWTLFREMSKADHIHLRSPGNMGLLGLCFQVFFPRKKKTVKYAGNWDDYPGEELTYRWQKRLAKHIIWSKHLTVLVYGHWPDFTSNCKSFFTASYREKDRLPVAQRSLQDDRIHLLFVGTLDERKRPEYAIEALKILQDKGIGQFQLTIIGVGPFEALCRQKIAEYGLQEKVSLLGNLTMSDIAIHANQSHFLIFLSRMEGWPKVVAESMWWGCVPVTTRISCVPWMLGEGSRGMLVERSPEAAADAIEILMADPERYNQMQEAAIDWARQYTLERFEREINQLL